MEPKDNGMYAARRKDALHKLGIKDDMGSVFYLEVRNVPSKIMIDVSAVDPDKMADAIFQQIYCAAHSRGYEVHRAELKRLL